MSGLVVGDRFGYRGFGGGLFLAGKALVIRLQAD
jgi:hypothetical protein